MVPVGTLQVEGGATWVHDDEAGVEVEGFDAPGTLLRYGLHPRVELRLAWPGNIEIETRTAGTSERISGVGSPELGMKFHLASESGARPEVALLAHVVLPVGDDEVGSDARRSLRPALRRAHPHGAALAGLERRPRVGLVRGRPGPGPHPRPLDLHRRPGHLARGALGRLRGAFRQPAGERSGARDEHARRRRHVPRHAPAAARPRRRSRARRRRRRPLRRRRHHASAFRASLPPCPPRPSRTT